MPEYVLATVRTGFYRFESSQRGQKVIFMGHSETASWQLAF